MFIPVFVMILSGLVGYAIYLMLEARELDRKIKEINNEHDRIWEQYILYRSED